MGGIFNPSAGFGGNGTSPGSTTFKGDTNYSIASTDRVVATNAAFTAARTWTLPTAASVVAGNTITIIDQQNTLTTTNTLTITANGADTIGSAGGDFTSLVLSVASSAITLMSDGVSEWFVPQNVWPGAGNNNLLYMSNLIQLDNAGSMTIANAGANGLAISGTPVQITGNLVCLNALVDRSKSVQTPITGFTITIANNTSSLILTPAGTLATGTINMPPNPIDGQIVRISSSQTITALTVSGNGNTISNAPTALTISTTGPYGYAYIFHAATTTWLRLQ